MGLSCGARCLKFCLFIFNLVFLICGIVCVGVGLWLMLDQYAVDNLATVTEKVKGYEKDEGLRELASKPQVVRQIGKLLVVGGLAVICVAFLGCCGAAKEWRPLLCCYAVCLMVILATEIAAAFYAAMHSHAIETGFKEALKSSLKLYNGTENIVEKTDTTNTVKAAWDRIMIDKECCGVDSNLGEFNQSGWYKHLQRRGLLREKSQFPPACCPLKNGQLQPKCNNIQRYGDGCYKKISESLAELSSHLNVATGTVIFVALIQVFGIVVAFCLCNSISTEERIW